MANQAPNKKVKKGNNKPRRNIFKEMWSELKKVSFPSFGKAVKQTGVVISVVLLFALVLFGLDRLLSVLYTALLG